MRSFTAKSDGKIGIKRIPTRDDSPRVTLLAPHVGRLLFFNESSLVYATCNYLLLDIEGNGRGYTLLVELVPKDLVFINIAVQHNLEFSKGSFRMIPIQINPFLCNRNRHYL